MRHYNDKVIAKVGYYLLGDNGVTGFALPDIEGVTYKERKLDDSIVPLSKGKYILGGRMYLEYSETLKKRLINRLFTNDDQIAIMLNKDLSKSDLEMYEFMQGWRVYFSEIITKIKKLENEGNLEEY